MMSSWKLLPSRCGFARKPCSRINARRAHSQLSRNRDAPAQVRKECEKKGAAAHVPGPLQLRDNVCRSGELRSSRYRLESLSGLSRLWEETRSQEPAAADGIPP